MKSVYVCGPLTDLPTEAKKDLARAFFDAIGILCDRLKKPSFVPHHYFDPIKHANATSREINAVEKKQVCENTSIIVVAAIAPSWGGGIEIGWADAFGIPGMLLIPEGKVVSRLLQGNESFKSVVEYESEEHALREIEKVLLSDIPQW